MPKIAFFELDPWEEQYLRERLSGIEVHSVPGILDRHHLPESRDADVLSVFVASHVTADVIEQFPNLEFITTRSTGFDHIDLEACRARAIVVANVPTYGSRTVAEFTIAMMLTLSRKVYRALRRVRAEHKFSPEGLRGFDLQHKTLAVLGTGHIGREVIKIATRGFDMRVLAFDAFPNEQAARDLGFTYVPLEQALAEAHVVTLHLPYLPSTHHLLNRQRFERMRDGALLINTARGGIVDTDALIWALHTGKLAGAALDVIEEEGAIKEERELIVRGYADEHNLKTVLQNHVLMTMENVMITPHAAFNTQEALEEILRTTVENVQAFLAGAPRNLVR